MTSEVSTTTTITSTLRYHGFQFNYPSYVNYPTYAILYNY